jgi:predicted GH43/DUF377 family glycosyl hydrolase
MLVHHFLYFSIKYVMSVFLNYIYLPGDRYMQAFCRRLSGKCIILCTLLLTRLYFEKNIEYVVSDQNRNSHFQSKPNIRQQKNTEYSVSAEYSALLTMNSDQKSFRISGEYDNFYPRERRI